MTFLILLYINVVHSDFDILKMCKFNDFVSSDLSRVIQIKVPLFFSNLYSKIQFLSNSRLQCEKWKKRRQFSGVYVLTLILTTQVPKVILSSTRLSLGKLYGVRKDTFHICLKTCCCVVAEKLEEKQTG